MKTPLENRLGTWRQFWVVFRFQAVTLRPWRIPLYMLFIFSTDILYFLDFRMDANLNQSIGNLSIILLPSLLFLTNRSILLSGSSRNLFPSTHHWAGPSEFLLTRAVDRRIFHRAMTGLLYPLVLAVPVAIFFLALKHPDLRVYLYKGSSPEPCLSQVPGSTLVASDESYKGAVIFIPHGRVLLAGWHLWVYFTAMLGIQLLYLVDAFKRPGWWKSFPVFVRNVVVLVAEGFVAAGLITLLHNEQLFFRYAAQPAAFWIFTVPLLFVGQFCCERLFERLEL